MDFGLRKLKALADMSEATRKPDAEKALDKVYTKGIKLSIVVANELRSVAGKSLLTASQVQPWPWWPMAMGHGHWHCLWTSALSIAVSICHMTVGLR